MKFVKAHLDTILGIILLSFVFYIFTVPFREKIYIFDWDQASDYESVEKIAGGKPTLIGPRVTSDTGFFLGPWHYYFLTPFFIFTKGSLFMGFWAVLLVQYLFTIISFVITKKWFGSLAAFTTGLMVASSATTVEWGFMYVPLLSLLFLFMSLKTFVNPNLLPLLFLFYGFGCTTYAVFYALGIPLAYVVIYLLSHKKVGWKKVIAGIILATIPYFPLLIFDLRHDFLNIRNMMTFTGTQHGQGTQAGYFIHVFFRAIETHWLNRELPTTLAFAAIILTLIFLISGVFILFKKYKIFMSLWLVSSLIPMAFYKGNVSEYYYAPVILLIPFFVSGLLTKKGLLGKIILVIFVFLLTGQRFWDKITSPSGITLTDKINAVEILEKSGSKYSVSYEFNLGEDSGYSTIFRKIGKNYVEDGTAQLFTLTSSENSLVSGTKIITTNKLSIYKR